MTKISCKWFDTHLDDYVLGSGSKRVREAAELHLTACESCRENVEIWAFLKEQVPVAKAPSMDRETERRLLSGRAPSLAKKHFTSNDSRAGTRTIIRIVAGVAGLMCLGLITWLVLADGFQRVSSAFEPELQQPLLAVDNNLSTNGHTSASSSDWVELDRFGRQKIEVLPGTVLWFEQSTVVDILVLSDLEARFKLKKGMVVAEIGPTPAGFRFIVETTTQEIEARGTVFSVDAATGERAADSAAVRVSEGLVEVRKKQGKNHSIYLKAGEQLVPSIDKVVKAKAEDLADDMVLVNCHQLFESASAVPSNENERPTEGMNPAKESLVGVRSAKGDWNTVSRLNKAMPNAIKTSDPSAGLVEKTLDANPILPDKPSALLKQAQHYRRVGDFQQAAHVYEQLLAGYPNAASAQIAMVSLGQLRYSALHQPAQALELFEKYLRQNAAGNLKGPALAGAVRALMATKKYKKAIQAAKAYERQFPNGAAIAEMIRRRAQAKAAVVGCEGAMGDFKVVIDRWPDSSEAQRAKRGLARCRAMVQKQNLNN